MEGSAQLRLLRLVLVVTLLSSCGIPGKVHEQAKSIEGSLTELDGFIGQRADAFDALMTANTWLAPSSERESWKDKFDEARREAARLKGMLDKEVKPLLNKNKRKDANAVTAQLDRISSGIRDTKGLAQFPGRRVEELNHARANATDIYRAAAADDQEVRSTAGVLQQMIASSKSRHSDRADNISSRTVAVGTLGEAATAAFARADAEFKKHSAASSVEAEAGSVDYAVFADSAKTLREKREALTAEDTRVRFELGQLDQSWSRTLVDMKQEFFLRIEQVSWNENSDYNPEIPYDRGWHQVSEAVFDIADDLPDDGNIANYGSWTGFIPIAPSELLQAVELDRSTAKQGFGELDGSAEYYIAESRIDCFHKYTEERNGQTEDTDWVPVSCEVYDDNYSDLGMTLAAKPYGKFADEVQEESAPPGMAYVGDRRYGEWSTDSGGGSFWQFYGQYAFIRDMLGEDHPGYYSRDEWEEYRRERDRGEDYYGGTSTAPRYGSASEGVRTSRRYSGSTFGRSGGFNESAADVRTAGVSSRGGGPGGSGK